MTNPPQHTALRRVARVLAMVPAVVVTSVTGVARADAPDQWADNPSVSPLHVLLVMLVIPLGLILLITLLVYIPSMSKNESYQPGQAWRGEPAWFGGPRGGLEAIEGTTPANGADGAESRPGGASGRW